MNSSLAGVAVPHIVTCAAPPDVTAIAPHTVGPRWRKNSNKTNNYHHNPEFYSRSLPINSKIFLIMSSSIVEVIYLTLKAGVRPEDPADATNRAFHDTLTTVTQQSGYEWSAWGRTVENENDVVWVVGRAVISVFFSFLFFSLSLLSLLLYTDCASTTILSANIRTCHANDRPQHGAILPAASL